MTILTIHYFKDLCFWNTSLYRRTAWDVVLKNDNSMISRFILLALMKGMYIQIQLYFVFRKRKYLFGIVSI